MQLGALRAAARAEALRVDPEQLAVEDVPADDEAAIREPRNGRFEPVRASAGGADFEHGAARYAVGIESLSEKVALFLEAGVEPVGLPHQHHAPVCEHRYHGFAMVVAIHEGLRHIDTKPAADQRIEIAIAEPGDFDPIERVHAAPTSSPVRVSTRR